MYVRTEVQCIILPYYCRTFEGTKVRKYLRRYTTTRTVELPCCTCRARSCTTLYFLRRFSCWKYGNKTFTMTKETKINLITTTCTLYVYLRRYSISIIKYFAARGENSVAGLNAGIGAGRGTAPRSWRARGNKMEGREVVCTCTRTSA